jgi:AcrR family transcriptional regulator
MAQGRKPSDVRRAQLLEAAVAVIGERGLCDIRISDVAHRARASPALLVYYFGTKERLLADALAFADERFYQQTARELESVDTATGRLVRLIELSCSEDSAGQDWLLWLDLWARAVRDPEVAARRELLDSKWRGTIADVIREGQESGEFDRKVDADDLALRLASLIDGLAIQVILEDPQVDAARMNEICADLVSRELGFTWPARRARVGARKRASR